MNFLDLFLPLNGGSEKAIIPNKIHSKIKVSNLETNSQSMGLFKKS